MLAPGVIPSLDGFLADQVAASTGDVVGAQRQFADELLQFTPYQPVAADQWSQYRQAEQGHAIDLLHGHSLGIEGVRIRPDPQAARQWATCVGFGALASRPCLAGNLGEKITGR